MGRKEPKNCWEFMNCPEDIRMRCVAYTTKKGDKCWLVATAMCPNVTRDFRHCWECPWYKKLNPSHKAK